MALEGLEREQPELDSLRGIKREILKIQLSKVMMKGT